MQYLSLVLKPSIVADIIQEISGFSKDFNTVLEQVKEKSEDISKLVIIFVGGLAANVTVFEYIKHHAKSILPNIEECMTAIE